MWGWALWILEVFQRIIDALTKALECLSAQLDKVLSPCRRTWYAPCDALTEWSSLQIPAGTTDRLQIVPAPGGRSGQALRVEVRDNDIAENPYNHQPIPGGWRAEAVGPTEQDGQWARYEWSTLFDPSYPANPVAPNGNPIWQVFTQWHQGDNDLGSSPPIEFTILQGKLWFGLNAVNPANENESIPVSHVVVADDLARGQWHNFRLEVRWSLTNGSVTVFHNGVEKYRGTGLATLFPLRGVGSSQVAGTAYLKMGLYRQGVNLGVKCILYHDEASRCDLQ
jgi:hypothetical protein